MTAYWSSPLSAILFHSSLHLPKPGSPTNCCFCSLWYGYHYPHSCEQEGQMSGGRGWEACSCREMWRDSIHAIFLAVCFQTSDRFVFFFQWTAPIPHVLGMVSVQRVYVYARRGGKVQTAARWTAMPFSVSRTAQVMAHLTLRLRLVAVNPCGQEMTAPEVSNSTILNCSPNVVMILFSKKCLQILCFPVILVLGEINIEFMS